MSTRHEGPLRIAQVAPPMESVPPKTYGGTERIVSWLTEELVRQGHDVTVYATGDSQTTARLVPTTPTALRLNDHVEDVMPYLVMLMERVAQDADEYDVIHFHTDHIQYPLIRRMRPAGVTTMHGRMDLPDLPALFRQFPETPLVSISMDQRRPLPWLNWVANIPHGMPFPDVPASEGRYLAFLGRTSPEKGLEEAIEIARRSDLPLRIAAKIDPVDEQYFDETIAPLLAEHDIEFVGEIGEDGKAEFLCGASALLFPINWPEPFGLVMIEAAACGTPVLAFRSGSVPEVIEDGVSGVIVEDVEAAVRALPKVVELPREGVRDAVRRRFNVERMAADYVQLYRRLIAERKTGESGDDRRRQPTAPVGPGVADWEAASESKPLERTSTIGVEHASNRPTD